MSVLDEDVVKITCCNFTCFSIAMVTFAFLILVTLPLFDMNLPSVRSFTLCPIANVVPALSVGPCVVDR